MTTEITPGADAAANHTPGPWRVAPPGRGHKIIAEHGGKVIGEANFYNEQAYANQQLMAAAPELLDALRRILRAHDSGNNGAVMGEATLCKFFADMARAAIAKAEFSPEGRTNG